MCRDGIALRRTGCRSAANKARRRNLAGKPLVAAGIRSLQVSPDGYLELLLNSVSRPAVKSDPDGLTY
jgi:hypothetical protein